MSLKESKFIYDVVIIGGVGRVGLPLGISLADKKLKVLLYDIDLNRLNIVKNGKMPFIEYGAEKILKKNIKNKNISISSSSEDISKAKNVIITIGTPIDEYLSPKFNSFLLFFSKINKYLRNKQNVIIRSSVYPGTCSVIQSKFNKKNKFNLTYCPERIVQGFAIKELKVLPQLIASTSQQSFLASKKIFNLLTAKIIKCSFEEAELIKLFNNSSRYIEFSISNQFYMISNKFNVDFDRIRYLMAYGYKRSKLLPSAGLSAGPCLLKDTMQLYSASNQQYILGYSAMNINEGFPNYIVSNLLNKFKLNNKNIGILGMAFKANIDDTRDSLSFKLKKILEFQGSNVFCTDPFVTNKDFFTIDKVIKKCKIIIIAAPHDVYKKLKFPKNYHIIDVWGFFKSKKF